MGRAYDRLGAEHSNYNQCLLPQTASGQRQALLESVLEGIGRIQP